MSVARVGASKRGRVLTSASLLIGFYVIGLLIVASTIGAALLMIKSGRINFGILVGMGVVSLAVIKGFFIGGDGFTGIPGSLRVAKSDQPELHALIADIATQMDTKVPDQVFLIQDVNAFVLEDTRLMGLISKQRIMGIGLGLVSVSTVDQLRGVIAHEFGHYAGGDTRLGPLVYRGRESMTRTLRQLDDGFVRMFYVWYFKKFLRSSMSVSRGQELTADSWSVKLAGTESTIGLERSLGAYTLAFGSFIESYVHSLWVSGAKPVNQFDGFRQMVHHPGNEQRLNNTVDAVLERSTNEFDSHPSSTERVAFMESLPFVTDHGDARPARELLRNAEQVERDLTEAVVKVAWTGGPLRPIEWSNAGAVYAKGLDGPRQALVTTTGADSSDAAVRVAAASLQNQRVSFSNSLAQKFKNTDDTVGAVEVSMAASIGQALVDRGQHRWAMSWTGSVGVEPVDDAATVDVWALASGLARGVPEAHTNLEALGLA